MYYEEGPAQVVRTFCGAKPLISGQKQGNFTWGKKHYHPLYK